MSIGSNSRLSKIDSITISADGKHLDEVQSFPYLVLVINKNLAWKDHVDKHETRSFAAHQVLPTTKR